ncbi:MAG: RNA polymerase sigma factor [Elusimicrobia bacterium]|nr:RNA polymerase sigma factor [Elusimicrobiota bacterium]
MSPKRDPAQMERLVEEHSERGYQFAYGLCGNSEEAKELVQEAFYRVFRSWDRYDRSQPLETWFLTILRNIYVDSVRSCEHRFGVRLDAALAPEQGDGATLADSLADTKEEAVLERLTRESQLAEVRQALDSLTMEHKAILTLFDVDGLGYEQIAEALDCPLGTVRSRLSRARRALKRAILKSEPEVEHHGM